jgi:hypothetical protein
MLDQLKINMSVKAQQLVQVQQLGLLSDSFKSIIDNYLPQNVKNQNTSIQVTSLALSNDMIENFKYD